MNLRIALNNHTSITDFNHESFLRKHSKLNRYQALKQLFISDEFRAGFSAETTVPFQRHLCPLLHRRHHRPHQFGDRGDGTYVKR